MTRFSEWRGACGRLLGGIAACAFLVAGAPDAGAHPFAIDTARMTGFKVVTAEDGAMAATDLVVIEYDGPIVFPMAENLREIWTEIKKQQPLSQGRAEAEQPRRHGPARVGGDQRLARDAPAGPIDDAGQRARPVCVDVRADLSPGR